MITPVVFSPPNQRYLYDRLIKHCRDLDGTEIKVITAEEPSMKYPAICNWSFRKVCEVMAGEPFVWLEADSIPVKAGWLKALEAEWEKAQAFGKSIVWTSDCHPPFDLCTGIGVYGPEALSLVPEGLSDDGFDGYILKNHANKIHKTPLIQHSYGRYNAKGDATLHRNPKVRDDAVIFHKDQYQDLISVEKHFGHSGDFGDIVYVLPLIQSQGGGYLWLYNRPFTQNISKRFDVIAPLLMAQPYIKAVAVSSGKDVEFDLSTFRSSYKPHRTLLENQCDHALAKYGLPKVEGDKPWLTAKKNPATKGQVVIARSPRYNTDDFPWKMIVEHYGDACVFIGLKEEYETFVEKFGKIDYLKTDTMLDVAEAIAGSDLFVGNQSSPYSVAEGLKHPRILEVSEKFPDCIYPNPGILGFAGHIDELPAAGGKERRVFERKTKFRRLDTLVCPPKGWRYPGFTTSQHAEVLAAQVAKSKVIDRAEALKLVYDHNCLLNPDFFADKAWENKHSKIFKAIQNAQ